MLLTDTLLHYCHHLFEAAQTPYEWQYIVYEVDLVGFAPRFRRRRHIDHHACQNDLCGASEPTCDSRLARWMGLVSYVQSRTSVGVLGLKTLIACLTCARFSH